MIIIRVYTALTQTCCEITTSGGTDRFNGTEIKPQLISRQYYDTDDVTTPWDLGERIAQQLDDVAGYAGEDFAGMAGT